MEEKRAALSEIGMWRGGKRRANSPVGGLRRRRKTERRPLRIARKPDALRRQKFHRSWPPRGENRRDEVVLRARATFSPVLRRAVTPDNVQNGRRTKSGETLAGAKAPLQERRVEAGEAVHRSFGANLIAPELEPLYLDEGTPVWQVSSHPLRQSNSLGPPRALSKVNEP